MSDGLIDGAVQRRLDAEILYNTKPIEFGVALCFASKIKERLLWDLLRQHDFDPHFYSIPIDDGCYLLDYRIFGLLYDSMVAMIFDAQNGPTSKQDVVHAEWLMREGEETYIYYSDDELITKVAEISCAYHDGGDCFVLCPISPEHNKFVPRLCYEELLNNALEIHDQDGFSIKIKEGKRIIHFRKMLLEQALSIYEDIIKTNPDRYQRLQAFVTSCRS